MHTRADYDGHASLLTSEKEAVSASPLISAEGPQVDDGTSKITVDQRIYRYRRTRNNLIRCQTQGHDLLVGNLHHPAEMIGISGYSASSVQAMGINRTCKRLQAIDHIGPEIGRMQNEGKPIPIQPERFTESFEPNEPLPRVGCMELP